MINLELKSVCESEISFVAGISGHEKMVTMNISDLPYDMQRQLVHRPKTPRNVIGSNPRNQRPQIRAALLPARPR